MDETSKRVADPADIDDSAGEIILDYDEYLRLKRLEWFGGLKSVLRIVEIDGHLECSCGGTSGKLQGDCCGHIDALQETGVDEHGIAICDAPNHLIPQTRTKAEGRVTKDDALLLAEMTTLQERIDAFIAKVEARCPSLHYLQPGSVRLDLDEDDGEIGTLARALGYLSCGEQDVSVLKTVLEKYPAQPPT